MVLQVQEEQYKAICALGKRIHKRVTLYNKSRMMGDYHVRFCERLRVKLPLSTRLQTRCLAYKKSFSEKNSRRFQR